MNPRKLLGNADENILELIQGTLTLGWLIIIPVFFTLPAILNNIYLIIVSDLACLLWILITISVSWNKRRFFKPGDIVYFINNSAGPFIIESVKENKLIFNDGRTNTIRNCRFFHSSWFERLLQPSHEIVFYKEYFY